MVNEYSWRWRDVPLTDAVLQNCLCEEVACAEHRQTSCSLWVCFGEAVCLAVLAMCKLSSLSSVQCTSALWFGAAEVERQWSGYNEKDCGSQERKELAPRQVANEKSIRRHGGGRWKPLRGTERV